MSRPPAAIWLGLNLVRQGSPIGSSLPPFSVSCGAGPMHRSDHRSPLLLARQSQGFPQPQACTQASRRSPRHCTDLIRRAPDLGAGAKLFPPKSHPSISTHRDVLLDNQTWSTQSLQMYREGHLRRDCRSYAIRRINRMRQVLRPCRMLAIRVITQPGFAPSNDGASSQWMTSSARPTRVGERVRPRRLAARRLIVVKVRDGCSKGRLATGTPARSRST